MRKLTISAHQLKSTFCLYQKVISMHYSETLNTRQSIARSAFTDGFYRCCETTRVHFMVLRGIDRTAWGTRLLLAPVLVSLWIVSVCVTQKAQHCPLSLNGCFKLRSASHPPLPPSPPSRPPTPTDSIHYITETKKVCLKNQQHSSSL